MEINDTLEGRKTQKIKGGTEVITLGLIFMFGKFLFRISGPFS